MAKPVTCISRDARDFFSKHSSGELVDRWSNSRMWQELAKRTLTDQAIWTDSDIRPQYLKEQINATDIYGRPTIWKIDCWIYKNRVYSQDEDFDYSEEQWMLLVHNEFEKERKQFEKLQANFSASSVASQSRSKISSDARIFVWQRDGGRCVECGSNENLEYDHIIPFSKGGSSTERNLQLLCANCNRLKSDRIQ